MTIDKDFLVNDRDGAGKTLSRKLLAQSVDQGSFNTVIRQLPNGDEVMLRTKGGMPEMTVRKKPLLAGECIKGPLTEIAFKYANPSAVTGYRRWYGEQDPAIGTDKTKTYEWSSDSLFCIESRKLQKICFTDGNNQTVDFLFAEKPEDETQPPAVVNPANAGASARFRFTEGVYLDREWYRAEAADIGWAFSGPTIDGVPAPEPATAVKFIIKRVRSIMFSISDTLGRVVPSRIKWVFANQSSVDRVLGDITTACTNQNARELSFANRSFFATNGNMDKLTLSVGLDEPPAVSGGPSFVVNFKSPGSFTAAINPEGAIGNVRPAQVEKAIDLCEFSTFGNPYHGLYWKVGTSDAVLYKDSTKAAQWPFIPECTVVRYGGSHRYYNVRDKDPLDERNQIKTDDPSTGTFFPDALIQDGLWYVKDKGTSGWGGLNYNEFLYKDPAGSVWVIDFEILYVNQGPSGVYVDGRDALVTVRLTLKRRFGVLGTQFNYGALNQINRVIGDFVYTDVYAWNIGAGFALYDFRNRSFYCAPDAKQVVMLSRYFQENSNGNPIFGAAKFTLDGTGSLVTATLGNGITATMDEVPVIRALNARVSGYVHRYTLDVWYEDGHWKDLIAVTCSDPAGKWVNMFQSGELLCTVTGVSEVFPVLVTPAYVPAGYAGSQIPDWDNAPLAWAPSLYWDYPSPTGSTYLIYRGAKVAIALADVQPYLKDAAGCYSAQIGWAYDYRTKELISVPFGSTAYFI